MKTNNSSARIHPENIQEMQYFTAKWGITLPQLNEAIVDTGSVDIEQLKNHLREKGMLHFTWMRWLQSLSDGMKWRRFSKA